MILRKTKKILKLYTDYEKYKRDILTQYNKNTPFNSLVRHIPRAWGRNNIGHRTSKRYKGHKKFYRDIDIKGEILNEEGVVKTVEYDPNRSAFISLVYYEKSNCYKYILAPEGIKINSVIISSEFPVDQSIGNRTILQHIPINTPIHNIELQVGKGGQMCRAAGTSTIIVKKEGDYAILKAAIKRYRKVPLNCFASYGSVSNSIRKNVPLLKAGDNAHRGRKPTVRGKAINAVNHPHGGSGGKGGIGRASCNKNGKICKNGANKKKKRNFLILEKL